MNQNVKQEIRFFIIFIPIMLMIILLLWFILGPSTSNKENLNKQEGIIVMKKLRQNDEDQYLLVIPDIKKVDLTDKTSRELEEMARKKDGAYYYVSSEEFDELEVGTSIIVYWKGNQLDSDPPQRGAKLIEVVSN